MTLPSTTAESARAPLRVGVLGSGGIATAPYGVLPNIHHFASTVDVVAIADLAFDQASAVAGRFGIPHAYQSLDEMLDGTELDAVVNLTPIPVHAATSRTILNAGKHLASEKPLAATMPEADELIELAQSLGKTIVCAPPDLLFEPYERAARLVASNAIGRVAFARVRSSHAGPGGTPAGNLITGISVFLTSKA